MKNILALLLSFMVVTAAFAQTQRDEAKSVILGRKKTTTSTSKSEESRNVILGRSDRYPSTYPASSRAQRIAEINREYDAKIRSIQNNPTLSRSEKDRLIRQLEAERRREIDAINGSYSGKRKHDDDDDKSEKHKRKGNNGNHYGWQKGKGNPHKED